MDGEELDYGKYDNSTRAIIDTSNALLVSASAVMDRAKNKQKKKQKDKLSRLNLSIPNIELEYEADVDHLEECDDENFSPFFKATSALGLGIDAPPPSTDTHYRPRTSDGVMTGFSNIRSVGRNVHTAEGTSRTEKSKATSMLPDVTSIGSTRLTKDRLVKSAALDRSYLLDRRIGPRPASSGLTLPLNWTNRRVNQESGAIDCDLTRSEWENEIARHILSLYATSKASEKEVANQGKSIISFVDSKRPDPAAIVSIKQDVFLVSPKVISFDDADEGVHRAQTAGDMNSSRFMKYTAEEAVNMSRPASTRDRSCLPLISRGRASSRRSARASSAGSSNSVQRCSPVWFVSAGDIYVDWTVLPGGQRLQARLDALYEAKQFQSYVKCVEILLRDIMSMHSSRADVMDDIRRPKNMNTMFDPNRKTKEIKEKSVIPGELSVLQIKALWKQLISTANAMALIALENKNYVDGHELLSLADKWCANKDMIFTRDRKELKGYILSSWAYYFYKRKKLSSAMTYTMQALKCYEEMENNDSIAICLLQISAIHCVQANFKEAHRYIYHFIAMVEEGSLAFEAATPQQLCLVAVAYNNLAVAQLKLQVPDLACRSSQNARKLARLCLSYSNRWLESFQSTHELALDAYKKSLRGTGETEIFENIEENVEELVDSLMR